METHKFKNIAESLRQYRRAELRDFIEGVGEDPVSKIYVDPLQGDAILHSFLSNNTTFLLGRKGTGKSTIISKAQLALKENRSIITLYLDVKALYDIVPSQDLQSSNLDNENISDGAIKAHMLRKSVLGQVIAELLKKINATIESMSLWEKWRGKKRNYKDLEVRLNELQERVKTLKLDAHELPILQKITTQIRTKNQNETTQTKGANVAADARANPTSSISGGLSAGISLVEFDKSLDDIDIYNEYSDVIYRSFPFGEIINEIQNLISECGLSKLIIFLDDFSELNFMDQKLFVDIVLAPLNNSSNETIKLKVAGYPGRVYYGKIDPAKIDILSLDFSDLYESNEIQDMEKNAIDYTKRLLETRFEAFQANIEEFFDTSTTNIYEYYKLFYQASFNVPRIIGHLMKFCYLDVISSGSKITLQAIRLASRKYYEQTVSLYFGTVNRYALEPFENKLDRYNQEALLKAIVAEARDTRKKIISGDIGGNYFKEISNPPTSHFIVSPGLEEFFNSLESNFFLSKYKTTRNKSGQEVVVFALYYGLVEHERMSWGYPSGREYRNYFVQRSFDYTRVIHDYLSSNQTIKCNNCGTCFPLDKKDSFEMFNWKCPSCEIGKCSVSNISDNFKDEILGLDKEVMLEQIELEILSVLNSEKRRMRAGEIASLIDSTHQMVGKRTSKLQDMGLIEKNRDDSSRGPYNEITSLASRIYFDHETTG